MEIFIVFFVLEVKFSLLLEVGFLFKIGDSVVIKFKVFWFFVLLSCSLVILWVGEEMIWDFKFVVVFLVLVIWDFIKGLEFVEV